MPFIVILLMPIILAWTGNYLAALIWLLGLIVVGVVGRRLGWG